MSLEEKRSPEGWPLELDKEFRGVCGWLWEQSETLRLGVESYPTVRLICSSFSGKGGTFRTSCKSLWGIGTQAYKPWTSQVKCKQKLCPCECPGTENSRQVTSRTPKITKPAEMTHNYQEWHIPSTLYFSDTGKG